MNYFVVYYFQSMVLPRTNRQEIGIFNSIDAAIEFVFKLPTKDNKSWEIHNEKTYQNDNVIICSAGIFYAVRIERKNLFDLSTR